MTTACEGIRVLDLTQGDTGPRVAMVLADFGAEVIRIEPQGGDPDRDNPTSILWNRGKKSIELDLTSAPGRETFRKLVSTADVLVESFRPGDTEELGISYEQLAPVNRGLVYCSVTGFGEVGPYARLKPYEGIVQAKAGRMKDQQGHYSDRPIYKGRDASYFAVMLALQGVLSALRARTITGVGQKVSASLLEATEARQNGPTETMYVKEGQPVPPDGATPPFRQESLSGGLMECKDGRWISMAATEAHFFRAWMKAIGLDWIWESDQYNGAPSRFPNAETREELRRMIQEHMKEKAAREWMEIFALDADICGDIIQTAKEVFEHPHVKSSGMLITVDDPRVGKVTEIGPLVKMFKTPAMVTGSAPAPGEHTEAVLKELGTKPAKSWAPTGGRLTAPLEGIIVLDLGRYAAGPYSTTLLSELGARVIRVEPYSGDPYRSMLSARENENLIRVCQGKESLAVDLKDKRGQEAAHRLAARADILITNLRPGTQAGIGMDYETLHRINPRLVYLQACSYGATGAYAHRPAFDGIIGAFTGMAAYQSGEGNPPMSVAGADSIGAAGAATAAMLGLMARLNTGEGQYLESAMVNSAMYCNIEDAFSYEGKRPVLAPDRLQVGLEATYRLYETDRGWVFFAAPHDDEFQRFCQVIQRPELANDPRFSTAAARFQERAALAAILEPVFRTRPAEEWEVQLTKEDVACVQADAMGHRQFLYTDPQPQALGLMVLTEHPSLGRYWRPGPMVRFSDTPSKVKPFCEAGEHTSSILAELGYEPEEIARLKDDQVVNWPAQMGEAVAAAT